ncbi:MAG: ligase-associated DNA damage response exonuclease [Rubrivivax sp.]|jgi:putative mRNA 3-end processing factor|nr:ligase-associated DNA damage response exonuclease [Rubrivivax sp.]
MAEDLIVQRPEGLYCPPGDFYIDPWRAVPRAVITHAHADHARRGHGHYLAHRDALGVLRARLGELSIDGLAYGETVEHRGVQISLHPAGHVLGSAQVRLAWRGQVWVASGDYFVSGVDHDTNTTCTPFEPVRCDCFITESTFGLPVYRWTPQAQVHAEIRQWWQDCAAQGETALLLGYSFGKAQRLLAGLAADGEPPGPIVVHPAVHSVCEAYRAAGVALPAYQVLPLPASPSARARKAATVVPPGAVAIAPPGVAESAWAAQLGPHQTAFASGWMRLRGARRRQGLDRGFVLSDHADWPGLVRAIGATGAERVIVTHGYEDTMVRWLGEQGLNAGRFHTEYGDERVEAEPA